MKENELKCLPEGGTAGNKETTFVKLTNSVMFHGVAVPH
jgi:hypothetical protein